MRQTTLVLPCLNEEETLAGCIVEAQQSNDAGELLGLVVVADNGSTDASTAIAMEHNARVVHVPAKGYGSALRGGIEACDSDYIVIGDADGSYDFGDLPKFIARLDEGADLVMGNRFHGGIQPGAMPWLHRYVGNPILSAIGRLFFRCPIGDFHCGLRAFTRLAYDRMQLTSPGMEFASEMVIKASLLGMRIDEVPTKLRPDGRSRPPHLRTWRDGWRHLRLMLMFCPRWLFIIPGITLGLVGGLGVMLLAILGPMHLGHVGLSVNTALACALSLVIGVQCGMAGVFADRLGSMLGTLPKHRWMQTMERRYTLEHGLMLGTALIVVGMCWLGISLWTWGKGGFGQMNASFTVRQVLPAVTLSLLGMQVVFCSFFLGMLDFCWRHREVRSEK